MTDIKPWYKRTKIWIIPSDWQLVKLWDLAIFSKWKGLPKSEISESWINKCIHYWELFTKYWAIISNVSSRTNLNWNLCVSKKNDTLMPTSDVTPNWLATASAINEEWVILWWDIMIVNSSEILNSFLSYYIRWNKNRVLKLVSWTTIFHIYSSSLKNFLVPLFDKQEQQKIADILSSVDELIDQIDKVIAKQKQLKKWMLNKLLSEWIWHTEFQNHPKLWKIPKDWEVIQLWDILEKFQNWYAFNSKLYVKSGYPIIRMSNINIDGSFYYSEKDMKYCDEYLYNQLDQFRLWIWDLIISMTDVTPNKALIWRTAIVNVDKKFVLNQRVWLLKLKNNYSKEFLNYWCNWDVFREYSMTHWWGSTQYNLWTVEIKNACIPLFDKQEQQNIADILSSIDENIESEENYKQWLLKLKQWLLQKLLIGEIRVKF